jgi:hypothetical protein
MKKAAPISSITASPGFLPHPHSNSPPSRERAVDLPQSTEGKGRKSFDRLSQGGTHDQVIMILETCKLCKKFLFLETNA